MTEADEPTIVYLDVDDEITSAAARLRRTEAERVVFVLPYGSRLATSRINFRLLAREAASRGKHLEIVAADASARALAGTAGLAVHASVGAFEGREANPDGGAGSVGAAGSAGAAGVAEVAGAAMPPAAAPSGEQWPLAPVVPGRADDTTETRVLAVPRSAEPVPIVGRARPLVRPRVAIAIALILLLVVGGGGLAAFLYLPSATIVLHPATQPMGPLTLTVDARTDVASPDPTSLVVPAHQYTFDLSASQTFTTTGKKVTDTPATGSVTFQNLDPTSSRAIPAGSVVSTTSGIKFATVSPIRIDRAKLHGLTIVPSTGSVAVQAVVAGVAGNVAANTITVIPPGYDPTFLQVNNPQPTTGGTHTETPQVSQQDVNAALATLNQALVSDLGAKVAAGDGVPAGTTLLAETQAVGSTTPSVDPTTLVGQAVATFSLGLTATGTAIGVDTSPVQGLAAAQLATQVTPGWQLVDGSTTVAVGRPSVSGLAVTIPVTASATEIRVVDRDALLAQIKGLGLPAARAVLEGYGQVQISLWPDWVTVVPGDTGRISLTIDTSTTSPSPAPAGSGPEQSSPSPAPAGS